MGGSNELLVKFIYENGERPQLAFLETRTKPVCCRKEMFSCGVVLGNTEGSNGMIENYWKCESCGKEIIETIS